MKKLFYFFLPLLVLVACENNGEEVLKDKSLLNTLINVSNFSFYGDAAVVKTSSEGAFVTLEYEVIPASCATVLSERWEEYVTLKAFYSNSEAFDFVEMPISEIVADEDNGIITVTASGENLSTEFYNGLVEASCCLIISDNKQEVRSNYKNLTCTRWLVETLPTPQSNEIYYTASNIVSSEMNDIESNIYDYTKGYYIMTFKNPITAIGLWAFKDCSNLTSITIPDSITKIGGSAFSGCSSLTNITIPNSVTEIGEYAFYCCINLASITIPASVTAIGKQAFYDSNGLTSVNITDIAAWCSIGFAGSDSNPLYYAHNLYLNGKLVTDLVIPDSVTTIGVYTFRDCSSLKSVTIPDSVTTIGEWAFWGCSSLTSVTIGDSVATIGRCAFYLCSNLISITIPDSVTTIEIGAFADCSSLTSVTIGDSVTTIGGAAFSHCSSLTSITIPDSVTTIGYEAFWGCSSLTSVTIPDSVTTIWESAFRNCSSLTKAVIGSGVKSIGYSAFENCYFLNEVICKPTTPPTGGSNMFKAIGTSAKIYVPVGSGEAYKTAKYWSDYASIIEEKAM